MTGSPHAGRVEVSAVRSRRLPGEPRVPGQNALFPGGRPFPGVQSITHRNALTVSSSVPPFPERLWFFTSLSERLHMLLPPPTPKPFLSLNSFLPGGPHSLLPQAQGSQGELPFLGRNYNSLQPQRERVPVTASCCPISAAGLSFLPQTSLAFKS